MNDDTHGAGDRRDDDDGRAGQDSHRRTLLHVIDKFSMSDGHPSSCTKLLADWAELHDPARFAVHFCGLQRDGGARYLEERGHVVHTIERGKISPAIARDIVSLARQLGAHLLHLHGYSAANFGRLAARQLDIPAVVHEHAILKVKPHQFLADLVLRGYTDCGVAISNAVREFMVRGRCIPRRRIEVIHNGVRLERFADVAPERVAALRTALGLADDAVVIGTVTRLREEKGNRYLVDAAARLLRQFPRAVVLVLGDGPERSFLEARARRHGIDPERFKMPGFQEDIPAALSLMQIAVVPSIREGLSLAVLEAMAAGKPIVATQVGGILELVAHEESAILVPPADGAALAAGIERLVAAPETGVTLAARARARSRRFSIEHNVRRLEELYERLFDEHARSHAGQRGQRIAA